MEKPHTYHEKPFATLQSHPRRSRIYCRVPRRLRLILFTITFLIVVAALLHIVRSERDYSLKQWPTIFTSLSGDLQPGRDGRLWHPPHPIRRQNGTHIDERYIFMRHLGKGREGSASLYVDVLTGEVVVVKTYTGIPRNPVPSELAPDFADYTTKWQVEIEASLHIGEWKNGNETAFVPVRDYFILESGPGFGEDWVWAFVTPFIEDGTLETLAKSTQVHERTPQKLDKIFRPVFDKLMENLKLLHDTGYCHDDIKPDNIFIEDTKHWLIGDLGNVRHFGHPWHDTQRWKRENQWSDCVYNDIRRLLKTYMTFLRQACGKSLDFDREFYREQQAWSKLYWEFMRQPVDLSATLELSKSHNSSEEPEWKADWSPATTDLGKSCLERKIDVELTTTTLHLGAWDRWPLKAC